MDKQKIIGYSFIFLFLIAAIVGYFILPDPVVLQVALDGEAGTTLPKLWAMLVIFGLGLLGGLFFISERARENPPSGYLAMVILIAVLVFIFIHNL